MTFLLKLLRTTLNKYKKKPLNITLITFHGFTNSINLLFLIKHISSFRKVNYGQSVLKKAK